MSDVEDRSRVASYIKKVWPQYDVVNNGWIVWHTGVTPPTTSVHAHMTHQGVRGAKSRGDVVRHPDVMVVDPMARTGHGIRLVVEIDGAVHDDKIVDTERRNIDYAMFGVPVVQVRPAELDDKNGLWRRRIREGMA